MRKLAILIAASAAVPMPAQAFASSASINLVAVIPVSCSLDFIGGTVIGRQIVINVRRSCNTGHRLVFNSASAAGLGTLTMRFNGMAQDFDHGAAVVNQAERYYNGVDQIVIEASEGQTDELYNFANALSVDIDTD